MLVKAFSAVMMWKILSKFKMPWILRFFKQVWKCDGICDATILLYFMICSQMKTGQPAKLRKAGHFHDRGTKKDTFIWVCESDAGIRNCKYLQEQPINKINDKELCFYVYILRRLAKFHLIRFVSEEYIKADSNARCQENVPLNWIRHLKSRFWFYAYV
jgi:hypothetical protein